MCLEHTSRVDPGRAPILSFIDVAHKGIALQTCLVTQYPMESLGVTAATRLGCQQGVGLTKNG